MGSWGVKALESDNGLDLISLLKTDYLPKHKKLTLGGLIGFLKEEGFLGETVSEIDFLYDNTAIALAELYSEWRETGKLNYDDEDSNVWSAITNFSASATARKDLLRRLRSIKNQVPDEDGEREIVELWKESNNWESWDKHLDSLIEVVCLLASTSCPASFLCTISAIQISEKLTFLMCIPFMNFISCFKATPASRLDR